MIAAFLASWVSGISPLTRLLSVEHPVNAKITKRRPPALVLGGGSAPAAGLPGARVIALRELS
jgi:hypothetical protein